ncbi:NitT/TauT family transport system permease protein [Sphaerotilus hippei]|uniref:NitT/TauT family transport system permease protein n=2 Tax=Sphaerotilus hippei TaxID=744406 RepID=A0A318GYP4_9BURK|nr:NitT/TauT family transport system permease protein [Sphaerotilus hippei]
MPAVIATARPPAGQRPLVLLDPEPSARWLGWAVLPVVLVSLVLLGWASAQMVQPYRPGTPLLLTLDPRQLPELLLRTSLRMLIALAASLLFAALFAVSAARSRLAERVLVPLLDVLQSIPVLGFLTLTVTGFLALFPGRLLGVECAAIFALFTSQAWNLAFSLHQSLRSVPSELHEAARIFQLSGWQRFWRLELPLATPALLWNLMMSVAGGWFFIVASEAITVSGRDIKLPGVGSYIALAIEARDLGAIAWAIVTMFVGLLLYDQLLFRPLLAWADRFRFEEGAGSAPPRSWLLRGLRRAPLLGAIGHGLTQPLRWSLQHWGRRTDGLSPSARPRGAPVWHDRLTDATLLLAAGLSTGALLHWLQSRLGWAELVEVLLLGSLTLARVLVLITLAVLVWVPVGVWIGLNPRWSSRLQVVVQFLAAFPANLTFPVAVMVLLHWRLDPDVWLSPLMVLGTQWYILFNVIAGAAAIPEELRLAAASLGLRGWLKWRRCLLPAVFPSVVTGAITASGGSWNASIVAECVTWGDTTLQARGLGSYIARMSEAGDFARLVLGIAVMCLFVMVLNRLLWRRLYRLAEQRWHG